MSLKTYTTLYRIILACDWLWMAFIIGLTIVKGN